MSTTRTDYVYYGYNLPYDAFDMEDYDPDTLKEDELILRDGMCGKYSAVGIILQSSDIYDGFGDGPQMLTANITAELETRAFNLLFKTIGNAAYHHDPRSYVLSHYS